MSTHRYVPGLEGVIAARTKLSRVDGTAGELVIAGYAVEELAPRAGFEEVVHLLWTGRLPDAGELASFRSELARAAPLSPATLAILEAAARARVPSMEALRIGAGALSIELAPAIAAGDERRVAIGILARLPTILAAHHRMANGESPIAPRADLGIAGNALWMLSGEEPDAEKARALETYLNTVLDHGLNASTFAARVIISTASDLVSAVVGGIGALKGPLHGGAPGPALDTVFEVGEASRAEAVLRAKIAKGERLMGFGHRIYRTRDPRADVLAAAAERMYERAGDMKLYTLARAVEAKALELLAEKNPDRPLKTNVEFYTALLLHGIGLPSELFTPFFAVARAAGWIAHCLEQRENGKLLRPDSEYVGPTGLRWRSVEFRSAERRAA